MPALKTIAAILYWAKYFLDGNFGYSKMALARWSGLKNGKAHSPGDFDCTSIIGAILYLAGYIPLSLIQGTWYSGNIADKLGKQGWRRISAEGKSLSWLNEHVTAGAVLVGPGHGVLGLGDGWILSWEYSEHHSDRGTVGRQKGEIVVRRRIYLRSKGWADLLLPPADAAATSATPTSLQLRAAQASQEAAHFGGPSSWTARGQKMSLLGASLIGATETTVTERGKTAWSGRVTMQNAIGAGWKRVAFLALCVFYPAAKYKRAGKVRSVAFGPKSDIWHGVMIVPFIRKDAHQRVDVGEVHIRPKSVATQVQKLHDVRRALALVDPNVPTILMGDWAGNWDSEMAKAGFVRVSLAVDTYDPAGVQKIDAIYVSHHLAGSLPKSLNPGGISDHVWLSALITKAAPTV